MEFDNENNSELSKLEKMKVSQKNGSNEGNHLSIHKKATVVDLHTHPLLNMWFLKRDLSKRHRPPLFYNLFSII